LPAFPTSTALRRLDHFTRQACADLASFGSTVLFDEPAAFPAVVAAPVERAVAVRATGDGAAPPVAATEPDPLDVVDPVDLLDPFEPVDRFELVEWLTPTPKRAVAPVREPFVEEFRSLAGPGSRALAERAWEAWEDALLRGQGVDHALYRAETAVAAKGSAVPTVARLWLSPWQLRRAAWSACRKARDAN
jgi:hypothetical protein